MDDTSDLNPIDYAQIIVKINASIQPASKFVKELYEHPDKKWDPDKRILNLKEELISFVHCQHEILALNVPDLFLVEHVQLMSAYQDITNGTQEMIHSFNANTGVLNSNRYDSGYALQKEAIHKIIPVLQTIIRKLTP
ncbi:hypothetical protein [Paenibacillus sp. FSL H7-0331]|uniref:hypothetical protein n=1 Tax=Paenibacillus sp. FSL H7-0331 TaxID=1920421 RepID=UPI00096E55AC|nr:hypothetical protein [Paenibacillus sp. FSL H7-0331]OMF19436.1 hypothetical protein BK127_05635 [Paenibacillus sp. FSL H7-0331]